MIDHKIRDRHNPGLPPVVPGGIGGPGYAVGLDVASFAMVSDVSVTVFNVLGDRCPC
jgi:hypothetical protein